MTRLTAKEKKALLASAFFGVSVAAALFLYRSQSMHTERDEAMWKATGYASMASFRQGQALTDRVWQVVNAKKKGEGIDFSSALFAEIAAVCAQPIISNVRRDTLKSDAVDALGTIGEQGSAAAREEGMKILRSLAASPERANRMDAAVALSHYPIPEARTLLENLTHDAEPKVAQTAVRWREIRPEAKP